MEKEATAPKKNILDLFVEGARKGLLLVPPVCYLMLLWLSLSLEFLMSPVSCIS